MHNWQIIAIIFVAGVAGGTVNFALSRRGSSVRKDLVEKDLSRKEWFWSVAVGLGAAFLMPLFLNTISSTLLQDILDATPAEPASRADIYVFGGLSAGSNRFAGDDSDVNAEGAAGGTGNAEESRAYASGIGTHSGQGDRSRIAATGQRGQLG